MKKDLVSDSTQDEIITNEAISIYGNPNAIIGVYNGITLFAKDLRI